MEELRYPIGKFSAQESHTQEEIKAFIKRIETLPTKLEAAIAGFTDQQLDTPYREGGWTVRQVVHHVADSHMNAYIRVKWVLSEETPLIKAYNEKRWAETDETKASPTLSLVLLAALHKKWVVLLKTLTPDQLLREYIHPDTKKNVALHNMMGMYAWHGEHHLAHITELKKREGWQ
jgi:hypothetical protein